MRGAGGSGRSLHLIRKDARGPGWTKRARMYVGPFDVRVCFEDATHRLNEFYTTPADAESAMDRFMAGATALAMRREQ
jgi:hypothetical protein